MYDLLDAVTFIVLGCIFVIMSRRVAEFILWLFSFVHISFS